MGDSEKEILNNTSIDDVTVEELTMKTAKTSKGRKKSEKVGFFASMKAEFKKIIWTNRQSLGRQTLAVLVCTVVLGLIIFGLDFVISTGFDKIFVK
mgnify:FL=1